MSGDPGLMRNLGAMFGEIAKAIKADVRTPAQRAAEAAAPRTIEVSSKEAAEPVQTPLGDGTARTITREEVEIHPDHLTARRITIEEIQIPHPPTA